jgi:hypothetical protein
LAAVANRGGRSTGEQDDRRSLVSTASIPVFTENGSNIVRMSFKFSVKRPDGSAVTGEECTVTLEGDGSLAPRHDSKRILRTTNSDGAAEVIWYRRGIYGRDIHATLSVESPVADSNVTIEANTPAST